MPPLFQSSLGRFRPLRLVYTGEATELWKVRDQERNEDVAMKIIQASRAREKNKVAFLKNEYQLSQTLAGPGLLKMYDWGEEEGRVFFTMEWFPAPSLKKLIRLGYENYAPVLPHLIPLLFDPLVTLAEKGYVHCDIKPDNFLYSPDAGLRLIDYAIARKKSGVLSRLLPRESKAQGTATYMAPEQIRREPLDERADLYALGGTLVELLTGIPPFTGNSMQELLQKHLSGQIPSILGRNKNVTLQMNDFVRSLLAPDKNKRPDTVVEARAYFKRIKIFNA